MHRQNMDVTGVIRHADGLFRCAVRAHLWLIGPDGHDRQFERAVSPQTAEGRAPGRIAAENDLLSFTFQRIAIITAIAIPFPTSPPMIHFKGTNFHVSVPGGKAGPFIPTQSLSRFERAIPE